MHGERAIVEEVIDWRPFESATFTTLLPAPKAPKIPMTYAFEELDDGRTRVEIRIARPKPKDRDFVEHAAEHFTHTITREVEVLRAMIEAPGDPAPDEEALPRSAQRHLTSPAAGSRAP